MGGGKTTQTSENKDRSGADGAVQPELCPRFGHRRYAVPALHRRAGGGFHADPTAGAGHAVEASPTTVPDRTRWPRPKPDTAT